jgi:glycosyltransferase involved in cell wall biosynthesis
MTRVLIVTTNYWPEPTGISVYTTDAAEFLTSQGIHTTVLTSLPHYPWWKIPEEYSHMVEGNSSHGNVDILRANHLIPPRMNALLRFRFEFSLWWNLKRISKQLELEVFDAVITYIPTVAAGLVAKMIAKKAKKPLGIVVQDLSGAGAKQSGLSGGAMISSLAKAIEKSVLTAGNQLIVVSPAMRDVIASSNIDKSKISMILNYSAKTIQNIAVLEARKRLGWNDKDFILIHTGNMGAKQDLGNVISAAGHLVGNSKIRIVLVGHGNQEAKIKEMCVGMENITVIPAVSDADYSSLLSAADMLLVNERATQMEMSLPSKLTSYLYSGRPVIAAVPRGGATWKFLDGIAELVEAGQPRSLAQAIDTISNQPEKLLDLADRGSKFAMEYLDPDVGRKKYLDWIERLVNFE